MSIFSSKRTQTTIRKEIASFNKKIRRIEDSISLADEKLSRLSEDRGALAGDLENLKKELAEMELNEMYISAKQLLTHFKAEDLEPIKSEFVHREIIAGQEYDDLVVTINDDSPIADIEVNVIEPEEMKPGTRYYKMKISPHYPKVELPAVNGNSNGKTKILMESGE